MRKRRKALLLLAMALPAGLAVGMFEQAASSIPPTNPAPTDGRLIRADRSAAREGDLVGQHVPCAKDCFALSLKAAPPVNSGRLIMPRALGREEAIIPSAAKLAAPAPLVSVVSAPIMPQSPITPQLVTVATPALRGQLGPGSRWQDDLPGRPYAPVPPDTPDTPAPPDMPPTDLPSGPPEEPTRIPAPPSVLLFLFGLGAHALTRRRDNRRRA